MDDLVAAILKNDASKRAFYIIVMEKLLSEGYYNFAFLRNIGKKESLISQLKDTESKYLSFFISSYTKETDKLIRKINQLHIYSDPEENCTKLSEVEAIAIVNYVMSSFNSYDEKDEFIKKFIIQSKNEYNPDSDHSILFDKQYAFYDYITLKYITSVPKYIELINSYKDRHHLFFRGQSNINYLLRPSIDRKLKYRNNEFRIYQELVLRCPKDFIACSSHLDFLVEMQHYGLPTRLLDISSNPLVAMYFAVTDTNNKDAEVIIFDAKESEIKYGRSDTVSILASLPMFNKKEQDEFYFDSLDCDVDLRSRSITFDEAITKFNLKDLAQRLLHEIKIEKPAFRNIINPLDFRKNLIVMPIRNNPRIIKQDGAFIICGLTNYDKNSTATIDSMRLNVERKEPIFIIQNKNEIKLQLSQLCINKASLFPEIDTVTEYIRNDMEY